MKQFELTPSGCHVTLQSLTFINIEKYLEVSTFYNLGNYLKKKPIHLDFSE